MMTEMGTPCFRVVRTDGTGTDFSYSHCVRGRTPGRKQEVSQAFRRAVRFDLYKARDRFFAEHRDAGGLIACAVTGVRIRPDEGHMDHRPPLTFEVIVTTFLEGRGLSLEDVPLTDGRDEQVSPELTDDALAEAFRQYHGNLARLDFVKDTVNLAQSSHQRLKPSRIRL
jgi:Arc/MetJ family transcription regulator